MSVQNDFLGVEKELREITADFASGHMNAFGSKETQDAFFCELKIIAEIETQVFNRTCSILKKGNEDDHTLLTSMFASARPPSSHGADPFNKSNGNHVPRPRTTTPPRASGTTKEAHIDPQHRGSLGDSIQKLDETIRSRQSPVSLSSHKYQQLHPSPRKSTCINSFGLPTDEDAVNFGSSVVNSLPSIPNADWDDDSGFSDKSFEKVTDRFSYLEVEFSTLGNKLQDILKHVTQLNTMLHQINDGFAAGSDDDDVN
ncbi:unnamed protein product [Phytomonas sp. Hart1]|nr:unnamed protein product [Phytomonas sp. Hart1]|eukprot:CCW66827.1 unnamed protein product [Phytomonas sp. isolate Hart1]